MVPVKNKIKAFTLSEMIVVLLITSLVVGLAYSVLRLVQSQMHGMASQYEANSELYRLRQALWIDFNSADRLFVDPKTGELYRTGTLVDIRYRFEKDWIIRQTDTFFLGAYNPRFLHQNVEFTEGEVDALLLTLKAEGPEKKVFVYKSNAATSYMNN
jgi:prepilin-type N-terminal cleavage/methylation domain-containing protein